MENGHHHTDGLRPWIRMIAWMAAGALLAAGLLYIAEPADAADMECSMAQCPEVKAKHRKASKKFRAGDTGRSDGFAPKKMFARPKAARRYFVNQIEALYEENNARAQAAASAGTLGPELIPVPGECQDFRCSAAVTYRKITDHADCVDRDPAVFPPNQQSCKVQDWKTPFTAKQVRKGGEVAVCAGEFAIAVATRNHKYGNAIAGLTGVSCHFALWELLD